jgi:hypothetical protein
VKEDGRLSHDEHSQAIMIRKTHANNISRTLHLPSPLSYQYHTPVSTVLDLYVTYWTNAGGRNANLENNSLSFVT